MSDPKYLEVRIRNPTKIIANPKHCLDSNNGLIYFVVVQAPGTVWDECAVHGHAGGGGRPRPGAQGQSRY